MDRRHFLASAASLAGFGAGAGLLSTLPSRSLAAGCNISEFSRALGTSTKAFVDLVSLRYFRAAMPPTLRSYLEQQIREAMGGQPDLDQVAMQMLGFALASPYFGVIK